MMRGIDLIGADEGGLIDAGAAAAKGLSAYFKKPDAPKPDVPKPPKPPAEEGGWWSGYIVEPVKVWHAIVGAVAVVGGVLLLRGRKK
jgi:hypothetical protein